MDLKSDTFDYASSSRLNDTWLDYTFWSELFFITFLVQNHFAFNFILFEINNHLIQLD